MKHVKSCLCVSLSLVLCATMTPVAFAGEAVETPALTTWAAEAEQQEPIFDKADWYEPIPEEVASSSEGKALSPLASEPSLVTGLSDGFKYFAQYESSCNYDQGFSYGDGYHALGYYQFDHRYGLQTFLRYCYAYDPIAFAMFEPFDGDTYDLPDLEMYDWDESKLTEVGQKLEDAWHAAYKADPATFSALQDTWSYETYYLPAERDLASQGIYIANRNDAIKGLCWGMANLFGLSGWHNFVGGYTYHYDDDGNLYSRYNAGCGLSNDMSDAEFATSLCSYVVNTIASVYPNQPQYHQGWQNRYRNEMVDCLSFIPDLVPGSWYDSSVSYVQRRGLITGYTGGVLAGRFGPEDRITRGQVAVILHRNYQLATTGSTDTGSYETSSMFDDVAPGIYYTGSINWAKRMGVINGYAATDYATFGPDDYVTREQLATMLANYARVVRGIDVDAATYPGFANMIGYGSISAYAIESLEWCVANGIISGYVNGDGSVSLNPQNSATRSQMAKMIMVSVENVF